MEPEGKRVAGRGGIETRNRDSHCVITSHAKNFPDFREKFFVCVVLGLWCFEKWFLFFSNFWGNVFYD